MRHDKLVLGQSSNLDNDLSNHDANNVYEVHEFIKDVSLIDAVPDASENITDSPRLGTCRHDTFSSETDRHVVTLSP